ncbi:MAG: ABC transporter ATP-binding protein, partial [Lachnospiraceae bacterium]|nr:ABC transporter ATP-binding protein [Lachnospiraceae bacterium]
MSKNLKKMISYYKPYIGMFLADMFFAFLSAMIALSLPLVVRYVTGTLIYKPEEVILKSVIYIALILFGMLAVDAYAK